MQLGAVPFSALIQRFSALIQRFYALIQRFSALIELYVILFLFLLLQDYLEKTP